MVHQPELLTAGSNIMRGLWWHTLTFKNRASYIYDGHTATLQMLLFIYFF